MPVDPRHGRFVPTGRRLAAFVRRVFRRQAGEAFAALRRGGMPNLWAWDSMMAEGAQPLLVDFIRGGAKLAWRQLAKFFGRRRRPTPAGILAGGGGRRLPPGRFATASPSAPLPPRIEAAFNYIHPEVVRQARAAALTFAHSTNRTSFYELSEARERLRVELATGLEQGDPVTALATRVGKIFATDRATMIAATEASRAMHAGKAIVARMAGTWGRRWLASSDACPRCLEQDGRALPWGVPFHVDPRDGPYAVTDHPPLHPHCVLGETPVGAASLVAACKVQYQGPVVRLAFSDGSRVAVTPNHMLLTASGFARAADLVEGDDVISAAAPELAPPLPARYRPHDYGEPILAEQVFNAFAKAGRVSAARVPLAAEYLHGDAAFGQSEIDVIGSYGLFAHDLNAGFVRKPYEHLALVDGHWKFVFRAGLNGGRYSAAVLPALFAATDGRVGRLRERAAFAWGQARHPEAVCLGAGPDWESEFDESPDDCRAADAERLGYVQKTFPGVVTTAKVTEVDLELLDHAVSVYDFETVESMYWIGNGIISSNCRCTEETVEVNPATYGGEA